MSDYFPIIKNFDSFTEKISNFGINVYYAGRGILDSSWNFEHECIPHTRLYFVNSGSGTLRHGSKVIPLEGGYVYVIPPGCDISHECTYLDKIWFHVNIHGIDKLDLMVNYSEVRRFAFGKSEFDDLYSALYANDYLRIIKVFATIQNVILLYTSTVTPTVIHKDYSPLIVKALRYIQSNLRINLSIDDIASALTVSPSTLRQKFKTEVGQTIKAYIERLVFQEAQKLLVDDWRTIDNISQQLGFNNRFYFSKRFKELFNQTPVQYRSRVLSTSKNKE